jgi:hypothetical protein
VFSIKDYVKKIEPYDHGYKEFLPFKQEIDNNLVIIDLTDKQSIEMTQSSLVKSAEKWSQDYLAKAKKEKREISFDM